ncbi:MULTISPECIES: hypothetical protein [Pseudomonadati]|uniref:Transcriptional regulator n=1 Tax=Shewanella aestuarii TaxID=1028752 RepID=A0ABT0L289_9GAMM|nr:hypothetical protein [Shewanella aestuarii]MCL1117724.1 hypothetical protein [Shewanella aestuarii]GGN76654.1 hypothetical protein GCM10009193_18180 [Shewanella aestuarii]
MAAFTQDQITFIEWLSQDNHIEVCVEICPDLSTMSGYETYSGHFQKRTLFKLKQQGFLAECSHFYTGVKWQRCTLNQRGRDWLKQHGGQSHA